MGLPYIRARHSVIVDGKFKASSFNPIHFTYLVNRDGKKYRDLRFSWKIVKAPNTTVLSN